MRTKIVVFSDFKQIIDLFMFLLTEIIWALFILVYDCFT